MLDTFGVYHIPIERNQEANALALHASGYKVIKGLFIIKEKLATQHILMAQDELARERETDVIHEENRLRLTKGGLSQMRIMMGREARMKHRKVGAQIP
jgi:hypothetical protein